MGLTTAVFFLQLSTGQCSAARQIALSRPGAAFTSWVVSARQQVCAATYLGGSVTKKPTERNFRDAFNLDPSPGPDCCTDKLGLPPSTGLRCRVSAQIADAPASAESVEKPGVTDYRRDHRQEPDGACRQEN